MKKVYVVLKGSVRDSGSDEYRKKLDKIFETKQEALCYVIYMTKTFPDKDGLIKYNVVYDYDGYEDTYNFYSIEEVNIENFKLEG